MKLLLEPTRRCSTPYEYEYLMTACTGVILLIFYSSVSFNDLCWVCKRNKTHENGMDCLVRLNLSAIVYCFSLITKQH
jgi:hypothetical protein